jgi:hypothetical protein
MDEAQGAGALPVGVELGGGYEIEDGEVLE